MPPEQSVLPTAERSVVIFGNGPQPIPEVPFGQTDNSQNSLNSLTEKELLVIEIFGDEV